MKALVLAGGYPQAELIRRLKARGYEVVLADYNEYPVARKEADIFYRESTLDLVAVEKIIRTEKVDLVMTVCTDQALLTVAYMSEKFDLPCYINYETALNVTNKSYMKRKLLQNHIPTASFLIESEWRGAECFSHLKYPLIVKPVDCNSSKGVKKIEDPADLEEAFKIAKKFSRTSNVVVEEFIDGVELSIDAIVKNGVAQTLCVSELQKIKNAEKFVINRSILPPLNVPNSAMSLIEQVVQNIAVAFQLRNCPLLVQLLYCGGALYVVEFSARTGGGEKYKSIKKYTGVDIIEATIDMTLGKNVDFNPVRSTKNFLSEFLYCDSGVAKSFEGFDMAKQAGNIIDYEVFRKENDPVGGMNSSGDRVASFMIEADSPSGIREKYRRAMNQVHVVGADGIDLICRDSELS